MSIGISLYTLFVGKKDKRRLLNHKNRHIFKELYLKVPIVVSIQFQPQNNQNVLCKQIQFFNMLAMATLSATSTQVWPCASLIVRSAQNFNRVSTHSTWPTLAA